LGRTISDTTKDVAEWLDQRQSQQFDAIYVPPGASVAIHINEQIEIDYDPEGRKTQHTQLAWGGQHRALD
jgi:cell division protein ZapB